MFYPNGEPRMSMGSATSAAALQASDRTTDKALAAATKKLAADRRANASDAVLRADQKTLSAATKAAAKIDTELQQASAPGSSAATTTSGSGQKSVSLTA